MAEELVLEARERKILGKKVKNLRAKNILPAVIYGHDFKPKILEIDYLPFEKVYQKAGESSLVNLKIDNQNPVKVIIQDVQRDPLTNQYLHVDFHRIKMTEKITTEVVLKFTGESPAVKEQGGILVKNLDKLEIECLPQDLVSEIEVDISNLKNSDDLIYVKDLKIPEKIKILNKPDETVILVTPPRSEEELKALEEEVGVEKEPELVEKKEEKEEGEKTEEKPEVSEGGKEDKSKEQK